MMKKAVPLSLLLASSTVMGTVLEGSWTVGTPAGPDATAKCCYYTGAVTITGTSVTGNTNTQSPASANTPTGPCGNYMDGTYISGTAGTSVAFAQTLATPTTTNGVTSADNTAAPGTTKNGKGATWSVNAAGTTLTFVPSVADASAAVCTGQTFSRSAFTISGLTTASFTAGTGTGGNTCCFLDTATPVVFTTASSQVTVTGKYGASPCTNAGGAYSQLLRAGTGAATGQVAAVTLSGSESYLVSADKNTVTYTPAAGCTQTLTLVSSSGLHLATAMTPVVVGAAVLGMIAV